MPQTSDAMRALMLKWFGDEVNETGPIKFLESRGYKLLPSFVWELPVPAHTINREEWACMKFLVEEWDFGTWTNPVGDWVPG